MTQNGTLDSTRRTLRTMFQVLLAAAALAPLLATQFNLPQTGGIVGGVILAAGAITRVMAIPGVNEFIGKFAPWLTKDGTPTPVVDPLPAPPAVPGNEV